MQQTRLCHRWCISSLCRTQRCRPWKCRATRSATSSQTHSEASSDVATVAHKNDRCRHLNDNKEFSARVIGADKTTDLALIKIEGKQLPAITIANSDDLKVGEWVLAVGNPLGLNTTVTAGS